MKTKTEYAVINPDDPLFLLLLDVAAGYIEPRVAFIKARAMIDAAMLVWVDGGANGDDDV